MIAPIGKITTVAIADDHTLMRTALSTLIATTSNYKVCILAQNGKDLLEQLDLAGLPDIILLDISMPVMDGFETMSLLKKKYKDPNVIALTMHDGQDTILKMSMLGVKGYILKTQEAEDILCTLDAVVNNEQFFSKEITKKLRLASTDSLYHKIASLKTTELIFLKLLCSGMTYGEVAANMHVSYYTIKDYSKALFEKFDLKSKTELILFAIKNHLNE